jgi:hypothetical protein
MFLVCLIPLTVSLYAVTGRRRSGQRSELIKLCGSRQPLGSKVEDALDLQDEPAPVTGYLGYAARGL